MFRDSKRKEEVLSMAQMEFEHRKLRRQGKIEEAEALGATIRAEKIATGEYKRTEQEQWDLKNGMLISAVQNRDDRDSVAQMTFDIKKLNREGREAEAAKLAVIVNSVEAEEADRRRREEKRAFEELQWEMAATKKATSLAEVSRTKADETLFKGIPLKEYERTQLEFELRGLAKQNDQKTAAIIIDELERRGISTEQSRYFWD